uniref:Thiamin biosynthesis protein S n=1 Tax=Bostrychia moritziana TaxID=103713 RepID=A0A1Z1M6Y9_BOSMO|nr:thiamin biosynthesis protein S [Bostrychia moritziana]ARW61759.1 thiamin biosynthesis protein S [Bostrychia moritziana]
MENYITVFVNGEPFNCQYSMSLEKLLLYLNFNINTILVEHNQEIINQNLFSSLSLKNYDNIEIITIVGGG